MILDYRVYCTLYALLVPAYFCVCAYGMSTVGNAISQMRAERAWRASAALLVATAITNILDWLWS